MDLVYSTIDIYSVLKDKYKEYLKPEIISVVMIQSKDNVYLESVESEILDNDLEKHTTRRVNLDFITEDFDDEPFFNPKNPIEENVRKLIEEFSPYSIINTTDLFREEACQKIDKKYNRFGIDK